MHLLYFVPDSQIRVARPPDAVVHERLSALGFDHVLDELDAPGAQGPALNAPVELTVDGRRMSGLVIAPNPPVGSGGAQCPAFVEAAHQTWIAAGAAGDAVCLGFDRRHPPRPADLARTRALRGHAVRLEDGQEWTVPVGALRSTLPETLALGPDGTVTSRVVARYEAWSAACAAWVDLYTRQYAHDRARGALERGELPGDGPPPSAPEWPDNAAYFRFACQALGANYHLGPWEVSLLGLLSTANISDVIRAAIGLTAVAEELAQKKTEGTPSSM